MNKASHKRKLHMARKMMVAMGIKSSRPPFGNSAWHERKDAIAERVKRNIIKVKKRKAARLAKI